MTLTKGDARVLLVLLLAVAGVVAASRRAPRKEEPTVAPPAKAVTSAPAPATPPAAPAAPAIFDKLKAAKEFEDLTGEPKLAAELADHVADAAAFYSVNPTTSLNVMRALLQSGMHVDDAKKALSAMIDVGVMKSWTDAYGVIAIYGRVHKRGFAQDSDVDVLADVFARPLMLKALGDATGVDASTPDGQADVERSLKLAKVKPRDFAIALFRAVLRRFQTKTLGEAALSKVDAG